MRRYESARVVVERGKTFVKVHLHPLAPRLLRVPRGDADKVGADAPPLVVGADLRVDQEGVVAAVPRDVDEADERPVIHSRSDPAEAVWAYSVPPSRLWRAAVGSREGDEFVVGHLVAPCEPHICQRASFARHRYRTARAVAVVAVTRPRLNKLA